MKTSDIIDALRTVGSRLFLGGVVAVSFVVAAKGHVAKGQERPSNRQTVRRPQLKRVRAPDWSKVDVSDIFFEDAFREALVGERPVHLSGNANVTPPGSRVSDVADDSVASTKWSSVIASETIEDEIKRLSRELDATVTQPAKFAGGGYQKARQQFSVLAALFAIVHEYDEPIRWKGSAAVARDKFAYGASIAKVGTIQVFNAAKTYKAELADLVRGDAISNSGSSQAGDRGNWTELLSRAALMQRLELSHQGAIEPALASKKEMSKQTAAVVHEAELTAAIGLVLVHDGMEEWDDDQYAEYCRDLKRGAAGVVEAIKRNDYEAAVKSSGVISKSCSNCHETYRG